MEPTPVDFKKLLLTLTVLSLFVSAIYLAPIVKSQSGARLSKVRFSVIKTQGAQVAAMKEGQVDMIPGLIRPRYVEELTNWGAKILSTPGGHFSYITFNIRYYTTGIEDGGPYGAGFPRRYDKRFLLDVNFRHAVAHLVPREFLIGSIFKYIVVRVDTVIVPQQGNWHNPNVPVHDYNPGDPFTSTPGDGSAVGELMKSFTFQDDDSSGTVTPGDYWSYDALGIFPLGDIDFLSPYYLEAPTSYKIVLTTIDEMKAVGLNNVNHLVVTFTVMLNNYVYPQTFDMYFLCWTGLGPDPDNIWAFFHSINDVYRGRNHPGLHEPVIDTLADIVHTSLHETEVLAAAHEAQYLLMSDTVPYGISYIPIYSRNFFDAYNPDLEGMVNMPLTGSANSWTFLNMHWIEGVDPHGDNSLVTALATDITSLNPLTVKWTDEVEEPNGGARGEALILSQVFDRLMHKNPYTLDDIPGMAEYRNIMEYTGTAPGGLGYVDGMKFTYNLRSGLKWHCGTDFTTEDIKFALDYLSTYKPGAWTNAWEEYVGTRIINATLVEIYYNTTSLWLKDTIETAAAMLPKHIWEGVVDWEHFDLWEETHAGNIQIPGAPAGHYMKKLCGTGPWIFDKIYPEVPEAIVYANPNYYETQSKIESDLEEMFYWYGDVNRDGVVYIVDLVYIGLAWASYPGHDRWNDLADLIDDSFIDIEDARVCGGAFGKKKWY